MNATTLAPYLPRIIAAAIAAFAGTSAAHGIEIDPEQQEALGNFFTLVIYAVAHKLISRKANPADAATTTLAVAGKSEQKARKGEV
jgi:hypothetical protein